MIHKGIISTAIGMVVLTLISKILGFIREMVLAACFGTSYIVDAYVMASTILSVLFGGLVMAISTVYMPMYSEIVEAKGNREGDYFTSQIIKIISSITILISIIGICFSKEIVACFASGFQGETAQLASMYVKIIFSYIVFSSIASIFESYLQYKGVFLPQIIGGFFVSISIIIFIFISFYVSYYYLAFGMLIGYALRFVIIAGICRKKGFQYAKTKRLEKKPLKRIVFLAFPTFIGGYITYINLFVDKTLASKLVEGSISALNYASLLNTMIVGITITILSTIIYPKLTRANTLNQSELFNSLTQTGINLIAIIAIPFSLGAILYAEPIVSLIYERGAFDVLASSMTADAFRYYAGGLVFMAANDFILKIYYSMSNMKIPMYCGIISVIINIFGSLILVGPMKHNGLALATSIALCINTLLLILGLKIKYNHIKIIGSKLKFIKIILSGVLSVILSLCVFILLKSLVCEIVALITSIATAIIIYIILLRLCKIEEVIILRKVMER
ncbi:murein biosynthesis integral membrane protein MurJ [Aminipila sp.]|uniref:murein biosynthesis integral membrane protein MurJ n=1 Tax=Aminipila sp. TaxID=2060095 RepID=UPI0028A120D6|nr:murein biosynthesis integral membrane protein MurJ [Aminipila sp.]